MDGGKLPGPWRADLERVDGWVRRPLARRPGPREGLSRGWRISSGWTDGASSYGGGRARAGAGRSRPPSSETPKYRKMAICGFSLPLLPLCLLVAEAGRSCGNPGAVDGGRDFQRLWEGPGVGGRWPGAFHIRSASTACEGESFACLRGSVESPWPHPSLRAGLRGRVRTCVQACVRLSRAACGLACGFARPDSAAPTPLRPLRIGSLADGELRRVERNLGEILEGRSKIFSLRIRWARIGSHGAVSSPRP